MPSKNKVCHMRWKRSFRKKLLAMKDLDNSNGIGKKYGFEQIELLMIAHGGQHNDTICTVEIKL